MRTADDFDERICRRMSYKAGDLICPMCDAVVITADAFSYFKDNGRWPDGHPFMDGKKEAF